MNEAEILYKMYKTMGELPLGEHVGIASNGAHMKYIVTSNALVITYASGEVEQYEDTGS